MVIGLGESRQAADAAGELQCRWVGLHGAVKRADQSLMGEEVAAQRVRRSQRIHAVLDARQTLHAADRCRLDLAQVHFVRGTERRMASTTDLRNSSTSCCLSLTGFLPSLPAPSIGGPSGGAKRWRNQTMTPLCFPGEAR